MNLNLEIYVCRAADEFRAAKRAESPKAAEAHRSLACEYVELIKCDGEMLTYRMLRKRRGLDPKDVLSDPMLTLIDAA